MPGSYLLADISLAAFVYATLIHSPVACLSDSIMMSSLILAMHTTIYVVTLLRNSPLRTILEAALKENQEKQATGLFYPFVGIVWL